MQLSSTATTVKEACTKWSQGYIEAHTKATGKDLRDLSQIGISSWSDQFIWLSTHCQVNLIIPQGHWHTFEQAQSASFLSIYTMLIQHTFQILEHHGISGPAAALHIPNFFNRHFDYFSWFIAGQSNWDNTEKNDHLERQWMSTRSIDFLATSTEPMELNNPLHLWERGKEKLDNEYIAGALEDFKKAISLDPDNYMILNSLGRTEFELENHDEADVAYSKALDLNPEDALILGNRAECRNDAGRYQQALEDINKSDEINPNQLRTCTIRCEIHDNLGNYDLAINDLAIWIEQDPDNAYALFKRGLMHERLEKHEEAIEDFKASLGIQGGVAPALLGLGNNYSAIGQDQLAISSFLEVIEKSERHWHSRACNGIGIIYSSRSEFNDAINWFTKAIEANTCENPSDQLYNAMYLFNRGNAKDSIVDKQGAINDYTESLAINPRHLSSLQNRAATFEDINEKEKAIQDYQQYLAIDPSDAFINCFLANLLDNTGSTEEAVRYWSHAIELNNDYAEALFNRGMTYEQELCKHELALADLTKAVELEPENAQFREILADTYFSLEQYEVAIEQYTEAIKLDPSRMNSFRWRGFAHRNLEQYEDAISNLSHAYTEEEYFDDFEELAECKHKSGDNAGALLVINEYLNQLTVEEYDASAFKLRSAIYEAQGQMMLSNSDKQKALDLELTYAEHLVEEHPDQAWCYSTRARARANAGDQEGAASDFCKAKELGNKDTDQTTP